MHVFFVQLEPDIEHITPIVYKLTKENPGSAMIVCTNVLYDIKSDYRLRYLRDVLNVKVAYIHRVHNGSFFNLRVMELFLRLPNQVLLRLPDEIWHEFYYKVKVMDKKWAMSFFQTVKAKSITVDEALPSDRLEVITKASRFLNIPVVMITTGNRVLKGPGPGDSAFLYCDYHIYPHTLALPPNSRYMLLGCMRYCEQWQKINSRLVREAFPAQCLPEEKGKLKVLIFGRVTRGFVENHSTVKRISELGFISAIFKTKPRTTMARKSFNINYNMYPSARLIQWADVVVCSISSIALDILYYDKIFIYPKYIAPDDESTFEEYKACWKVDSEEELIAALEKIHEIPNFRPYSSDSVNSFFRESVYRGDFSNDVLGMYAKFYSSI